MIKLRTKITITCDHCGKQQGGVHSHDNPRDETLEEYIDRMKAGLSRSGWDFQDDRIICQECNPCPATEKTLFSCKECEEV